MRERIFLLDHPLILCSLIKSLFLFEERFLGFVGRIVIAFERNGEVFELLINQEGNPEIPYGPSVSLVEHQGVYLLEAFCLWTGDDEQAHAYLRFQETCQAEACIQTEDPIQARGDLLEQAALLSMRLRHQKEPINQQEDLNRMFDTQFTAMILNQS